MGIAMMGTGEADGEKRAEEATNAALLNPLIDEYSLKGAKGLLVNITGGSDLTLFEVDEAVNKIRAEVDPEAELIFGSIEDEKLNGKIRVSIVATSLDAQSPQTKPVVSMIHRIHNRNNGYNEVSTGTLVMNQTLGAIDGATALDINTSVNQENVPEQNIVKEEVQDKTEIHQENISLESATYMENNQQNEKLHDNESDIPNFEVDSIELATPELFSQDQEEAFSKEEELKVFDNEETTEESSVIKEPEMFDESESEEDLEIPAFLRKQKN